MKKSLRCDVDSLEISYLGGGSFGLWYPDLGCPKAASVPCLNPNTSRIPFCLKLEVFSLFFPTLLSFWSRGFETLPPRIYAVPGTSSAARGPTGSKWWSYRARPNLIAWCQHKEDFVG